jgi:hypothetical protein
MKDRDKENKESGLNHTLSDFLLRSASEKSNSGQDSVKDAILKFLSAMSRKKDLKVNNGQVINNNDKVNSKRFSDSLRDFLESTKLGNTEKSSDLKKINLTDLINVVSGDNTFDVEQLRNFLMDLKDVSRNEPLEIYESMLNNLNKSTNKIKGLDLFLASSAIFNQPKFQSIDVSTEIVRTNFTLTPEEYWDGKNDIPSEYYLFGDSSLLSLPKVANLTKPMEYLNDTQTIKRDILKSIALNVVIKKQKTYPVPDWAVRPKKEPKKEPNKDENNAQNTDANASNIDMRVKQLNRLSIIKRASAVLPGTPPKSSNYIKSLHDVLVFENTSTPDGKKGFSNWGMTRDELINIRKDLSLTSTELNDTTRTHSNAKKIIMQFSESGLITYGTGTLGTPYVVPGINLGNFMISKKPLSSTKDNYSTPESVRKDFYHEIYNMSVEALLRKAPDFRQNLYHGVFVFNGDTDFSNISTNISSTVGKDKSIPSKLVDTKNLVNAYLNTLKTYYVRMQNISIPGASADTYTIPFLNRNIKKIGGNFTESHKMTIEFVVDEMGIIIRAFNILTGQFGNILNDSDYNKYANTFFPTSFNMGKEGKLDLVVTYNDFRINPTNRNKDCISNFMPATQNVVENDANNPKKEVFNRDGSRTYGDVESYRQFVLEDVKILGISGKLQFKRDDANKTTIPVDIIYKRITTVDNNLMK